MTDTQKASPDPLLGRRAVLGAAALGSLGLMAAAPEATLGLNARAMRSNRFYGTAVDGHMLATDRAYMHQVRVECGMVVAERVFKWGALHPKPAEYDFKDADLLMAYARQRSLQLRGHTLLWHADNPKWLEDTITPANAESLLTAHIRAVAGHFRNHVVQWDVVNEVLDPENKETTTPLGLRDTLWSKAMGAEAIEVAFHACAEADDTALRCINDYGMDYDWDYDNRKRDLMLGLLRYLKDRNVPVQALGMQAHLQGGVKELNQTKLAQFCADVASMGLKIVITELDVRDNRLPADITARDAGVAAHARAYLDVMLESPALLGVLTWGLSDRRSWLNDILPRDDKLQQRALPLDDDLQRKPMWTAMAEAFDAAPVRV